MEHKRKNRFSVKQLVKMVECLDILGGECLDYSQMNTRYQEKTSEYDRVVAAKQFDKHFLKNRLDSFYEKHSDDLPALEKRVVLLFNALSGQY